MSEMLSQADSYYEKPHLLMELAKAGTLDSYDYMYMDILFQIENNLFKVGQAFSKPDSFIVATGLMTQDKIQKSRKKMKTLGLIDFEIGHRGRSTIYKILIQRAWLSNRAQANRVVLK